HQRAGKEVPDRKQRRRTKIHDQSKERQEIRIYARGRQRAHDLIEQPLAARSDCSCQCRSHAASSVSESAFFAKISLIGCDESYTSGSAHRKPSILSCDSIDATFSSAGFALSP